VAVAIELKKLSKTFDQGNKEPFHAVNSLDLSINRGHVFGFLGPNGAGKTTTLKMICGLITQSKGSIHLNGYDILTDRHQAMRQIGVVLEGARNIYWQLSALENLLYYGRLKGYAGKDLHNRATILLHDLELWERRYDLVGDFSRGTQQKVAIACALIANPPIVLFDEPTLGLDVQSARTVKKWIMRLARDEGKTIVITTHQLDIAEQLCDYVAIMNKGRLIVHKPMDELLSLFKQEFYQIKVAGYLNQEQSRLFNEFTINQQDDKTVFSAKLSNSQELYLVIEKMKANGLSLLSASKVDHNLEEVFVQLTDESTLR
jgi:ABC-2 type transport system ATP-binding protein